MKRCLLALALAASTAGCERRGAGAAAGDAAAGKDGDDGRPLVVFAAASLSELAAALAANRGGPDDPPVRFNFAGSNELARGLIAGAAADVFLSADERQAQRVVAAGRGDPPVRWLGNRLCVIAHRGFAAAAASSPFYGCRRVALADPEVVPAGVYARQWLERSGQLDALRPLLVPTIDVRAAYAAVESAAADCGIVYYTDVHQAGGFRQTGAGGRGVTVRLVVPASEAPPIRYAIVVVSDRPAARRFADHLLSPDALAVSASYGFDVAPLANEGQ